jgi:methionyl-tRNA formyltransferase
VIVFAAYRDWAINSCSKYKNQSIVARDDSDLTKAILTNAKDIEAIIFIGWSSLIPDEIINTYLCVCYHPSDLPKYRGGSPLQHQIIDGLILTKGTLFKMDSGIDSGPIFNKESLSLMGDIDTIFEQMTINAMNLIDSFIERLRSDSELVFRPQSEEGSSMLKRRTPSMSEITIEDLQSRSGEYLSNKIRCLGDPYPNAFIRTSDGKILMIKDVELK